MAIITIFVHPDIRPPCCVKFVEVALDTGRTGCDKRDKGSGLFNVKPQFARGSCGRLSCYLRYKTKKDYISVILFRGL